MRKSKTLIAKLRKCGDLASRTDEICQLLGLECVQHIRPVYPDSMDDELDGILEIVLHETASATEALAGLQASDQIEYAHEAQERYPN